MKEKSRIRQERSYGIIPFRRFGEKIQLLLIRHNAGHWAFPKGRPEPGESALESATREFEEETGVTHYRVLDPYRSYEERYSFRHRGVLTEKTVTYFLAEVLQTRIRVQEEEVQAYDWLGLEQALERITFDACRGMLGEARVALEAFHQSA